MIKMMYWPGLLAIIMVIIGNYSDIGYNLIINMQNLGGLFCSICLDYFCKPVAAICGHSFCQLCLEEYFLHFNNCPVCDTPIRKQKIYKETCLSNFVQNFLQNHHTEYLPTFWERVKELSKYKEDKIFTTKQMIAGHKIDIRDSNYLWREGRIVRIISRVGEIHKYIKVQYLDCQEKIQEELKVVSERLAKHGFYTARDDLPKFSELSNLKLNHNQISHKQSLIL